MTLPPLVVQGFELAALGMGTVFTFLTMLVFATMAMSKLVALTTSAPITELPATSGHIDHKKLAVITAAIHQHRNQSPPHGKRHE